MTQDEIKRLLKEIPHERQRLMIKVGFLHGLRISELINLKKENIQDGYVSVQRLKGSLKTTQPYVHHPDPELDESGQLGTLYRKVSPGEILFPMSRSGVFKLMRRAGTRAGIPIHKLHPHVLKHSCAKLAIGKMGIDKLRQYLGHKSISSTGEYLRDDDESASQAFSEVFK